ncbi:NUDIX hydrolase [Treponema sp. HNW]|uniref:NUDIX hydrolase n=1 Tax=Treponema sp. HNW TaxID=3116654 RepID=UPI003D09FED3
MNGNEKTREDTALIWKTGKKELLCKTPVFTVNRQYAVSPEGLTKNFITMDAADWVICIPVLNAQQTEPIAGIKQKCFVMVEQWRHGAKTLSIEFPGGVIDKGESPECAAARELSEETGFTAGKLISLGAINPNPALFSNTVHFFAAENLVDTKKQNPDEDEFIKRLVIPAAEVIKKTGRPPYIHALMAAALGLYLTKHCPVPSQD